MILVDRKASGWQVSKQPSGGGPISSEDSNASTE